MKTILFFFLITFSLAVYAQVFDITNFGAVGNGTTLNTQAIQAAVDSCSNSGGGIVKIPVGNFLTATVFLKSNVTIQIDSGATITGSSVIADYPDVIPLTRSFTDSSPQKSVFYAEGQHNIAITGKGTFQGNGFSPSFFLDKDHRPYGFRFFSCSNIRYEGVTLRNSGFWMMHNFNIDTLVIKNLTIVNQAWGNNDGINIDGCRNVLVDNCTADCNDDPIVIKTTSPIGSNNIEIKNCTVATYSRALKIGTETFGDIKNVYIHDCQVIQSTLGPLTGRMASAGINIAMVNGGSMENILFENITMSGINTPFLIRLGDRGHQYTNTAPIPPTGSLRNVELRNITATASTNITSSVTGVPNYDAKNIRLKDIDITFPGGHPDMGLGFIVPENVSGKPDANMFGDTLPAAGIYIRHVDSISLCGIQFHAMQTDSRPTFVLDAVQHFDSSSFCLNTAIAPLDIAEQLMVFPNPAASTLNISVPKNQKSQIQIFNTMGILLKEISMNQSLQIDISDLPSGLFFLRLKNQRSQTIKFIKQ